MANNGADVAKNGDEIIQKITELENHFSYVGSPAEKPWQLTKKLETRSCIMRNILEFHVVELRH